MAKIGQNELKLNTNENWHELETGWSRHPHSKDFFCTLACLSIFLCVSFFSPTFKTQTATSQAAFMLLLDWLHAPGGQLSWFISGSAAANQKSLWVCVFVLTRLQLCEAWSRAFSHQQECPAVGPSLLPRFRPSGIRPSCYPFTVLLPCEQRDGAILASSHPREQRQGAGSW